MSKPQDRASIIVWYDTEFSSLELDEAHLMQVSAVITDSALERVLPPEDDLNMFVKLPEEVKCSGWVNQHLQPLVRRCRSEEAGPVEAVNKAFAAYIDKAVGSPSADKANRPVVGGNSLQCDWHLARKFLPDVVARLHYRIIDVSSFKMVWQNCRGKAPFDKSKVANIKKYFPGDYNNAEDVHDAHFDVLASIAELNYYLQHTTVTDGTA